MHVSNVFVHEENFVILPIMLFFPFYLNDARLHKRPSIV